MGTKARAVANSVVETMALDLLERVDSDTADLVFLFVTYDTGGMGSLAFDPRAPARDLGEHLEHVSRLLQQSRRILTDGGTLFLRTDPFIAAHHQLLASRVLGAHRFATQIIVPSEYGPLPDRVWPDYDVILVYTRSESSVLHVPTRPRTPESIREQYRYSDARGPYRLASLTRPAGRGGFQHEWKDIRLPPEHEWRYRPEIMDQLDADGRIWVKPGRTRAYLKLYLSEAQELPIGSVWESMRNALLREHEPWPEELGPMLNLIRFPLALVERIILMGSSPGDMVVAPWDAAGSFALTAASLGRRWAIGVNVPSFTQAVADRLIRHGYNKEAYFEVINFDDLEERLPPVSRSYEDYTKGLAPQPPPAFVLGEPVLFEESLHVEFKEVRTGNPIGVVKDTVDRYAVGFLNREGGRIFWGIRNRDCSTTGVRLDSTQRDGVRKLIVDKLAQIDPPPAPTQYRITFHQVFDQVGARPDLWVVELRVSRGDERELYCTSGGTYWMKTESGVVPLAGRALMDEIKRRQSA